MLRISHFVLIGLVSVVDTGTVLCIIGTADGVMGTLPQSTPVRSGSNGAVILQDVATLVGKPI